MNRLPYSCLFEHECSTNKSTKAWYLISVYSLHLLFMIVYTVTDHDPVKSWWQFYTDYLMISGYACEENKINLPSATVVSKR